MVETYVADNGTGPYKVIGQRKVSITSFERVCGRAKFAKDYRISGMLFAKSLRTPYPHCKVTSMDTSAAEKLPGVKLVMNQFNFPQIFRSPEYLFAGEEIAAVVAVDEDTCYKAIQLITVQYEKLPYTLDMYSALEKSAPLVWADSKSNLTLTDGGFFSDLNSDGLWNKRVSQQIHGFGDTEAAFKECETIVEVGSEDPSAAIKHSMVHCPNPRGVGATVDYTPNDPNYTMTAWSDNQGLYNRRDAMSAVLKIPTGKVHIINPYSGSSWGGGTLFFGARREKAGEVSLWASKTLGVPVYDHYDYHEESLHSCYFQSMSRIKIGFKPGGIIWAWDMTHYTETCNNGTSFGAETCSERVTPMLQYNRHCRAVKLITGSVATNRLLGLSFVGWGTMEGAYAAEIAMDHAAEVLNMDPIELRKINCMKKGGFDAHWGNELAFCSSEGHKECLDAVSARSNWKSVWTGWAGISQKTGEIRHGIGVAIKIHAAGSWDGTAMLTKMYPDGSFECVSSVADSGQSEPTAIIMITAEVLGLPYEKGSLSRGTTAMPFSIELGGSTGTWNHGYATWEAAMNVRKQVLGLGAELFNNVDISLLDMNETGVFLKSDPTKPIAYNVVFARLQSRPEFENRGGEFGAPTPHEIAAYAYRRAPNGNHCIPREKGASIATLDVDTETGQVSNVICHASDNVGRLMNPFAMENQEVMGVHKAGERVMWSEKPYDPASGRDLCFNWIYDHIATHMDFTATVNLVELPGDLTHPFGATAGSEGEPNPHGAAISNAIYNAIGKRMIFAPFTPAKILQALGKV